MVKKLRRRFVVIHMLILTLVMVGILCGIYALMQRSEQRESEQLLQEALGGSTNLTLSGRNLTTVELDTAGIIRRVSYSMTEQVPAEELQAAVPAILEGGLRSGSYSFAAGSFLYQYIRTDSGFRLALLDTSVMTDTMRRLRRNFIFIGGAGLLLLSGISLLLACWAIRPIAAAWDTQKHFVADASHELKTPLTVIATNTDLVLANPEATIRSQTKWLDYVKEETTRMSQLVANLLLIAKIDANEIKAVRKEMDLSAFLEEACLSYETPVFEAGRLLEYAVQPGIHMAADREKLKRVLDILLDNAVKYSNPGSEIHVRLAQDKLGRICLLVSDTGEQIPKACLPRLFDRFYRVDHSRARNTGGYGLGLNIAKCIVGMHEGTISASSDSKGVTAISMVF